ncbi:MAG: hypothetical protein ACT4NT_07470 [Nitrososphaerota archaeon]
MANKFALVDVSSESIMNVAKVVSSAPSPMPFSDIVKALETRWKENYLKQVIIACLQLQILRQIDQNYTVNTKYQDGIKRANKNELIVFFREALQDYPPFLMYADFLSTDFDSTNSAAMIRGIMQINTSLSVVEKALRLWGSDAGLIIKEGDGFRIPKAEKGLPSNYVKDLLEALDSEFQTKMFLINTLNPEVYNCLTTLGLDISDLAKALLSYEVDPKQAMEKALSFFEAFLAKFGSDLGINVQGKNGVNSLINEFYAVKKILKNQQHVGNGLGGCRNISAHGVDSETGKEWNVTPQASLSSMLMIPVVIRSYYLYIKKQEQGF